MSLCVHVRKYVCVLACTCVQVSAEPRRGQQISWSWMELKVPVSHLMWVLGTTLPPGRAASAFNPEAISQVSAPHLVFFFFKFYLFYV